MTQQKKQVSVLCVDDNPEVAEALKLRLSREKRFRWVGWLPQANDLLDATRLHGPTLVLLDLDMPGVDPFEAMASLSRECPDTRVVVFTGHVRLDFIDRALEAGAWGFASKNDGEGELLRLLSAVAAGEVAFTPEARAALKRR
ncbi:Putative transcriptional regulator [Phycisphaerales bacterium]|nr:Putative transcriptional regulator [Phycisphaerales bacterium]